MISSGIHATFSRESDAVRAQCRGGVPSYAKPFSAPVSPHRPARVAAIQVYQPPTSMGSLSESWEAALKRSFTDGGHQLHGTLKIPESDIQSTLAGSNHMGARLDTTGRGQHLAGYGAQSCNTLLPPPEALSAPAAGTISSLQGPGACSGSAGLAMSYPPSLYNPSCGSSSYAQSTTSSLHTPSASHPVSPTLSHSQAYCISQPQTQPQSPVWGFEGAAHCLAESSLSGGDKEFSGAEQTWNWKLQFREWNN